jgi:microcin C transport system substrate-binding protein
MLHDVLNTTHSAATPLRGVRDKKVRCCCRVTNLCSASLHVRGAFLLALWLVFLGLTGIIPTPAQATSQSSTHSLTGAHALALYGTPKYKAGFRHFDYVNPDAPKGGWVRMAADAETFDSLNPFILKGIAADGLNALVFEPLMRRSADEPATVYGLIADRITVPASRAWTEFHLNPKATFSDGTPVTVDDVIFSFETLKTRGHPFYRIYFAPVAGVQKTGPQTVRFAFKAGDNRELPLIVADMPVLSKGYYTRVAFERTSLDAPVGSGPYLVDLVKPGRTITYRRNRQYWGADLPVNRGIYNFDRIIYDYYRDATVALEAFKAGRYDFRLENVAKNWATAYDFPAVKNKQVIKAEIPHGIPTGMQAFIFNLRKPLFQDIRVRQALSLAFDFEWCNRTLFYGTYKRNLSYFANSELAATGVPTGQELAVLEPFKDQLSQELFQLPFTLPVNNGPDDVRFHLRKAQTLLQEAGFTVVDNRLIDPATGKPVVIELLLSNLSFERVVSAFAANLKRLGITLITRSVDASQYQNRVRQFDFDMIMTVFPQTVSPGNEQRTFWESEFADEPGSQNLIGIKNPVVDKLVAGLVAARDWESLKAHARALDRVLLWQSYVVPNWYLGRFRMAYWNKFGRPDVMPLYATGFPEAWWAKDAVAEKSALRKD